MNQMSEDQKRGQLASLGISPEDSNQLESQILDFAKSRNRYTSLMANARKALSERYLKYQGKEAGSAALQARYQNTTKSIVTDLQLLDKAETAWANPFHGNEAPSSWLAIRFKEAWNITPVGRFAQEDFAAQASELWSSALHELEARQGRNPYTSITEALQGLGFERKRAGTGLQHQDHPTFMRDGLRIAMRRGGPEMLSSEVVASANSKSVTIEAIFTAREMSRITDMRDALKIITDAADDLDVVLYVNPFPVMLGPDLKPLNGAPLIAFYEGIGFTKFGSTMLHREPLHDLSLKKLLKHKPIACSDQELEELAIRFRAALQAQYEEDGFKMHHLFDPPAEVVRTEESVSDYVAKNGYMCPAQARETVESWKQQTYRQGNTSINSEKVVISLFDLSGEWSKPWREAGYDVHQFDIQAGSGVEQLGINTGDVTNFCTEFFNDIYGSFEGKEIYAIIAANPCTDFASSGAKHFEAKDAAGITAVSVELVKMTLATVEYFRPAIWAIENPTGRIERLGGLPPWSISFEPHHFGEDYTKRSMLWGRMNGNLPIAPCEATEGSKMHRLYGGKSIATKNARSVTPEGFAYAFFMANNAADNPLLAISNKYDRLDKTLIEQAVKAGISANAVDTLVEDFYYFDLDDDGANNALREAVENQSLIVQNQDTREMYTQYKAKRADNSPYSEAFTQDR